MKNWLDLFNLTVGLAGAQLAWTVELGYGTPYLLSLGLSKQATSLVWIAGPLSGLIVQPLIGHLSDNSSTKRYRRRFYIVLSSFLIVLSTLMISYAKELSYLVSCPLLNCDDWDPPTRTSQIWTISFGIFGFYLLDFSLNGLQASMRALTLDKLQQGQQGQEFSKGNAWLGRQTHFGNLLGYSLGYFDLGSFKFLKWIKGGGQFRKLSLISCFVMSLTVLITCTTQHEEEETRNTTTSDEQGRQWKRVFMDILNSIRDLPLPIRRVCYVQFFSWTGWFPLLFYSTTYVSEYTSHDEDEQGTRQGSFALLLFSIVSIFIGFLLPFLTSLGDFHFIQNKLSYSSRLGRFLRKHVLIKFTLRNCWTFGLILFGLTSTLGTTEFFGKDSMGARTKFVAFQGINWAITCWVPFGLVMEYIKQDEEEETDQDQDQPLPLPPTLPTEATATAPSTPRSSETSPLLSSNEVVVARSRTTTTRRGRGRGRGRGSRGGTILGIHNLSIVLPQFFVAIFSAIILKITSTSTSSNSNSSSSSTSGDDVVWVLRFGGLASLIGAIFSRWVFETKSEREYVDRVLYGPSV